MVPAESMDIGMAIGGDGREGPELVNVPSEQSVCMADQSVAWSGPR